MKLYRPLLIVAASLCLAAIPSSLSAEDVKAGMNSLLAPFRGIQPFIADETRFADPNNTDEIARLLQDLRKNFHRLETIPSRYHALPGFDDNSRATADLLDDAARRFSEGKKSYAWWRLRKLPTDCFTCHATYKVSSHYSNEDVVDPSLDPLNRARFLLATRQFAEAKSAFQEVLRDPESRFHYDEALRSLLLITTRITQNPKEGAALFEEILANSKVPEEDAREVQGWIKELSRWAAEKQKPTGDPITFGEKLITSGLASTPDTSQNDVALLRGTSILHQQLETGALSKARLPRALYLLGYAYMRLPLFFAETWAEMYLERCMTEFPGSADAKLAYKVYRDHIIEDYTGSAGTNIPDDIKLHLEELRKKAFGEPGFGGMVKVSEGA